MKKLLTAALIFVAGILFGQNTFAQQSPKREMRSAWLTTYVNIDWPSKKGTSAAIIAQQKEELIEYLDNHKNRNFTGVCFHVRSIADAMYKSSYEPWSQYLTGTRGTNPGWDPLAFAVEEAHKRGLEIYAWVNPFRFNQNNAARNTAQDKAVLAKDGWIISHNNYDTFNPGLPEVREYLINILREIYLNYRVDGLVFDDYFYASGTPCTSSADDYSLFLKQNPNYSGTLATAMGNWRRANVNTFIKEVYNKIQSDRPDLRFGVSPRGVANDGANEYRNEYGLPNGISGTYDGQYNGIFANPIAWLVEGTVDFIAPQIYWFYYSTSYSYTTAGPYDKLAEWWSIIANKFNRHLYVAIAAYRLYEKDDLYYNNTAHWKDLSKQIEFNRSYDLNNAPGTMAYSARYMDGPRCSGWGDYLQANSFQNKALMPVITWKDHEDLTAPAVSHTGNNLTWTVSTPTADDPIMRYTIYAVPSSVSQESAAAADGDGINNKYLLDVSYSGSFEIPSAYRNGYWYAVCAYDGYGYESDPTYVDYSYVAPDPDAPETPNNPYCERDETTYPAVDKIYVQNLWYRSTTSAFNNITFLGDNGVNNRSIAIAGDYVYLSGRDGNTTSSNTIISQYDLKTGEFKRSFTYSGLGAYPCNDICSDANGNIYFSNLAVSANSSFNVYKFYPELDICETVMSVSAPNRIDHATVYADPDNANRLYIYAAASSGSSVARWTVVNGTVSGPETMTAQAFYPASSSTFGYAPRVAVISKDRIVVNGTGIHPTEYDFTTGKITSSLADASSIIPSGSLTNGFAHFGPAECYMAYPIADHQSDDGYKFVIASNSSHGFTSTAKAMWTLPAIDMGSTNSTTYSTPVAAKTVVNGTGWDSYIALFACGNTLAVYKMSHDGQQTSIDEVSARNEWQIFNNTFMLDNAVNNISIYRLDGQLVATQNDTAAITLPASAGLYIVRYGNKAARIAVK